MAMYSVKTTKKKQLSQWRIQCHRESVLQSLRRKNLKKHWVKSRSGIVCWGRSEVKSAGRVLKQVRVPLEGSERSVSACCSSPPGPSWRCRSEVGWSPSPGRTISHNTLRRQCCLRRKAEENKTDFNKMKPAAETHPQSVKWVMSSLFPSVFYEKQYSEEYDRIAW